jgi:N-acylneuraminate cytidylyltransferase/CMP-N,N'-diacetyllegionaminic acid synthase
MLNGKTFLAIIPARGGSKGLPRKNVKMICGKPLIAWTIEAGLKSKYLDEVMVSTDYRNIADVAKEFGANIPFLRPHYLANDTATSFKVIEHTIDFYRKELNQEFDYVVLLEPTSPLRVTDDIDTAIEMLMNSTAESIVGICRTEDQNPAFLTHKNKNNFISCYEEKEIKVLRRQDISDVYFFEGTIYISEKNALLKKKTFYHNKTIGYEVPKYKSLEIDDIYDFVMVDAIMQYKGFGK